ncbi:hypothetical protein M3B43_12250 [Nesterenkonia massiliensis]|uniref:Uncharacterized protein n=1 Tax=Nesterenkonia massiliensis TaxID=1232429 RepID=A0ABT2HTN7_9MICC|nr:hypothetical protein [Nesterenkonia massiliensis]MCT1608063.1 hypothetical protein [Nesterenkonia massiliensis]
MSSERAQVWTTERGAPEKLIFRGQRMKVVHRPIYWVGRREPWWQNLRRLPETDAVALLERHMWQITAKDIDTGEILTLDVEVTEGRDWPATIVDQ